ncbi:ABC transporter permease [Sulfitobacter sp. EhC04]|uniref:ABC transporter permease n=1 Tax=Sulfitobacter sp. EhC04 TaxID=1849168 RepID=UPI0007F440CB|nr:ABC transporter permease [Sulfitobacter sp. EhC04]OAN75157.1 ABC transporter permease [Sulfitobacter sp. EhC04]
MTSKPIISVISLLLLIAFWAALAMVVADADTLPRPDRLIAPFFDELRSGDLWFHLSATLVRVAWAFVFAMSLGTVLGYVMGRFAKVNLWLDPWLVLFLNLPALVLIVLCYLWVGLNEMAAILAVTLNKVPNVAVVIREGVRARSQSLDDLAQVYELSWRSRLWDIAIPQLAPYLIAAGRGGLSIIWKIVLVVELLGRSNGIGFQIHLYFQLFDITLVLVYALSFVVVMLVFEWLFLQPLERRISRWRSV